jgi:hypothetical protein
MFENEVTKGNTYGIMWFVCLFKVFSGTFNNISIISWQSVLMVEETRVPRENHPPTCCKSLSNFFT